MLLYGLLDGPYKLKYIHKHDVCDTKQIIEFYYDVGRQVKRLKNHLVINRF